MAINKNNQNNVEWYYAHEADLTIGEAKISPVAKIALVLLILVFIAIVSLGVYFHTQIYDYIVNPNIVLSQNEVVIGMNDEFDPKKYVIVKDSRVQSIIYPDMELIDFSIEGEYELQYIAYNSMHQNVSTLRLIVEDDEPPVIVLKNDILILTRGEDTKNFDPLAQIEDYYDNYTPKDKLKIEYTNTFNWSESIVRVNYVVTDAKGLSTTATLIISVSDESTHDHEWDDGIITTEATVDHPGVKTFTCNICGETTNVPIPQIEREPVDTNPPDTDPPSPGGDTKPPQHTHNWGNGTITKQATCTSQGTRTYTCSGCGQTKTEAIATLAHNYQLINTVDAQVGVAGYKEYRCSSCGNTYRETIPAKQKPSQPYINGVHDITVKIGISFQDFVQQLTAGVQGSGYVSVNYSQVNLTIPGKYTVTFTSDDGVTKTCTVTVIQ